MAERPDFLVVDVDRVFEESEHGRAAAASMKSLWERTQARHDELAEKFEKAAGAQRKAAREALVAFEAERKDELGKRRQALRGAVSALISSVIQGYAKEHGVEWIIDRRAALVFPSHADVTAEILRRVNAVRPSSPKK
jgi:Skp family chaperone for outer membrane proteins